MPIEFIKRLLGKAEKSAGTVLVVDDDVAIRELLEIHLKNLGYAVCKAESVEGAWALLEKAQAVNLFLLDIKMKGEDGFTFANQLRKDERTRRVPILFVSGAYPKRELEKLTEVIANSAAILKPFTAAKLKEAIATLAPAATRHGRPSSRKPS